jgi:hypothetical protein
MPRSTRPRDDARRRLLALPRAWRRGCGGPPKVMSERLGHATVAFTLDTYTSALPAIDKSAARCGRRAHSWHRGSPGSKTREMTMALSC